MVRKLGLAMERKMKIATKTTTVARPWVLRKPPLLSVSLDFPVLLANFLLQAPCR